MANPYASEVPFPLAGEGVVIRLTMRDLAELRGKYGPSINEPLERDGKGRPLESFWFVLLYGLDDRDPAVILDLLGVGLKKPGGKERLNLDSADFTFSLEDPYLPLLDAIALVRTGKPHPRVPMPGDEPEDLSEHPTTGSAPATS